MAIKIMEVYVPETGLTHHINIDQIVDIAIYQTRTTIRLSTGDQLHTDITPAEAVEQINRIQNELPAPQRTRKIIQITQVENTQFVPNTVMGLCDDGSIWMLDKYNNEWNELDFDVPQD